MNAYQLLADKVCWKKPYLAYQKPEELARFLALLDQLQPKTYLEIGTHWGGTTWAIQQVLPEMRIICIDNDILDLTFSFIRHLREIGVTAECIKGNSTNPRTLQAVRGLTSSVDFLFIDGGHTSKTVKSDWHLYHPLVRKGGAVAFHDIVYHPEHGVHELWEVLKLRRTATEIITKPLDWGGIGVLTI
jgi:predicted O-methyltransferase YrrM